MILYIVEPAERRINMIFHWMCDNADEAVHRKEQR